MSHAIITQGPCAGDSGVRRQLVPPPRHRQSEAVISAAGKGRLLILEQGGGAAEKKLPRRQNDLPDRPLVLCAFCRKTMVI